MGTGYTFDGSIDIEPALNFAQIRKAQKIALDMLRLPNERKYARPDNVFSDYMPLRFQVIEKEEETDEGVMRTIQSSKMVPSRYDGGSLSYGMGELLFKLATEFSDNRFSGTVMALGEDRVSAVKMVVEPTENGPGIRQVEGATFINWGDTSDDTPVSDFF